MFHEQAASRFANELETEYRTLGKTLNNVLTILYPDEFKRIAGRDIETKLRQADDFQYKLVTRKGQFPQTGWVRGGVADIASALCVGATPTADLEQAVTTMLHLITQVLGDSSLECATLAAEIFLQVVRNPQELDVKRRQAFLVDLEGLLSMSDIVRYRVYELAVKMALGSGDTFEFVQSSGLLQRLVKELDLDDVLVKMNCIELLATLMESSEGVQFLESEQVIRRLHAQLLSAQQDPFGSLIIPGVNSV